MEIQTEHRKRESTNCVPRSEREDNAKDYKYGAIYLQRQFLFTCVVLLKVMKLAIFLEESMEGIRRVERQSW